MNHAASKSALRVHGVVGHNFVAYLGGYLDPVDEDWNGEYRARANKDLSKINQLRPLSGQEKIDILTRCYYDFNPESVRSYFRRAGLIGTTSPRSAVLTAISQASEKHREKFDRLYKHQLLAYIRAAKDAGLNLNVENDLIGPWWDLLRNNQ